MHLLQFKKPVESKGAWDYHDPVGTIPAQIALKPLSASTCERVKKQSPCRSRRPGLFC